MFNLSMPELAVIGVVALLVLGPERLPGAARTVGALMRRAQRSWTGLRGDIERELAADELKRSLKQARDEIGLDSIKRDLDDARDTIVRDLDPRPSPASSAPPVSFPGAPRPASSIEVGPPPAPDDVVSPGESQPADHVPMVVEPAADAPATRPPDERG
jgi:sec-independent protein translocase protein TatB